MTALILCGGYGTRLGELTKNTPKPMIKIGGKSILQHIVDRLYKHGITKIIIKTHYLSDQIMEGIGDRALYYYEPVLFNAKESIRNLQHWLSDEEFMVINGDTISEIDYTDMISFHWFNAMGKITAFMDEDRAAGTWIYPKRESPIQKNISIVPYRPKVAWFDCGRPDRLEAARAHFERGEQVLCPV